MSEHELLRGAVPPWMWLALFAQVSIACIAAFMFFFLTWYDSLL